MKLNGVLVALAIFSVSVSTNASTNTSELSDFAKVAKSRCLPVGSSEEYVYNDDFRWNMSLEEVMSKFNEVYTSGDRLKGRAYYDSSTDQFILNLNRSQNSEVSMPIEFAFSIKKHIEEALKREYTHAIIFPDMGHLHFFIPEEVYEKEISPISGFEQNKRYNKMLRLPGLKMLYHTAEQIRMKDESNFLLDDEMLRWRYYTRNLIGDNKGERKLEIHKNLEAKFNTVRDYPGYKYWGAGADFSASKDGCFPFEFKGQTYYFDISLESLPIRGM